MNTNIDSGLGAALNDEMQFARSDEDLTREIMARIELVLPAPRSAPPVRRSVGRRRSVLSIALACFLIAGGTLAVAQADSIRTLFGGDAAKPANKVDALQRPDNALDMSVFADASSTANSDQRLAAMFAGVLYNSDTDGLGEPMPSFARMLLDVKRDGVQFRIAGMPTTTGDFCIAFNADRQDGASCIRKFSRDRPVNVIAVGRDGRAAVLGAATDDVEAVAVKLPDGSLSPAQIGRNAYLWTGAAITGPVQVVATLRDGSTVPVSPE